MPPKRVFNLDDQLAAIEERNAGISWSLAVDLRLDDLLDRAREAGERTTRKEVAAAIVGAYEGTGEELGALVRRHRLLRARDVLRTAEREDNVVSLPPAKPGPRRATERRK